MTRTDRMPPLADDRMDAAQRAAAADLAAGPRGGVKGPFIPLLRSPELLAHMQRTGEYLRFHSVLPPRVREFATLLVARQWTQQFEWRVHVPLALAAGISHPTIDALRQGRRPPALSDDERLVHDFVGELVVTKGVADATYEAAVRIFGERGVVELVALVGYFTTVSMILNVAHTPAGQGEGVEPLLLLPL